MNFPMPAATNIFDPGQYAQVRLPFLEASTLPPWCYTSEEFYQREVDRIFRRSWNFVGREDQIPHPGDYFTLEMFGESFIFIRDRAGSIHAFANTCRHRGCRLLAGEGNRSSIICPYHAWTYGPNGDLIGMRGMEKTAHFDAADYGLIPLRLESWAGFLFLNLDETAGPLQDYLGDLPEQFSSYEFSDMVCVRRKEYDLACNWKLYIENAMEDYHTAMVHNASIGDQETAPENTVGQWDSIHMESDSTIAVLPGEEPPFAHIPSLRGKAASGTYFTVIYPSTFFATTQDCMWWLQQLPDGPARTRVVVGSCFPRSTVARPDFEEQVEKYYRRWDKSLPEDNEISEFQQLGLASSFGKPGRFSWREPIVHAIANWVLERTLDAPIDA